MNVTFLLVYVIADSM